MPKAVTVKYLPHDGKRGARLQASDPDRNRVQVPYDLPGPNYEEREAKWRRAAVALYEKMKWSHPERLVMGWVADSVAVFVEMRQRDIYPFLGDASRLQPSADDEVAEMLRKGGVRGINMACVFADWLSGGTKAADNATIELMIRDLLLAYGWDREALLERLVR